MFTIKNAIKNIYRYKNKYILFGVLYFILILAASVCTTIFVQMEQVTEKISREYAGVVDLNVYANVIKDSRIDFNAYDNYENWDWSHLPKEEYLRITDLSERIEEIKFLRYNFAVNNLKEDVPELITELNINGVTSQVNISYAEPVFVLGYNMEFLHLVPEDFDLESGRMFENDNECVIDKNSKFIPQKWDENSESLVSFDPDEEKWNDLNLGDKIVIKNDDGIYKEYTIVGIQKEKPEYDEHTNRRIIYTTLESAEYFDSVATQKRRSYSVYHWAVGEEVSIFEGEKRIINTDYEVIAFINSYENLLEYLNEMEAMGIQLLPFFPDFRAITNITSEMYYLALIFMVLIGSVIVCITIITTAILLNSRKYEIAILRSIGMKKSKLVINYLIENLAFIWGISVVSLIIAQFISGIFTESVFVGIKEFVSPEFFESLTKGVNITMVLQNIGLVFDGTTAVVMLSLVLACINIVRFEPLKIFNKRY